MRVFIQIAIFILIRFQLYGCSAASLLYHIESLITQDEEAISFEESEVAPLWERTACPEAELAYYCAKDGLAKEEWLEKASNLLREVLDEPFEEPITRAKTSHTGFDTNPYISKKIRKKLRHYLLPITHAMNPNMDAIFLPNRVTQNLQTFQNAGFHIIGYQARSFVVVASHSFLPDHLIKAHLDSELREKQDIPSWEWLLRRCIGVRKLEKIIRKKKIKHYTVPNKWIYPLSAEPSPPNTPDYRRKIAILIVEDMHLVPHQQTLDTWKHHITKEHLRELYTIISKAYHHTYRPDNIPLTTSGKFAFIDTEYKSRSPKYETIRPYLSSEMCDYWDQLVNTGGRA